MDVERQVGPARAAGERYRGAAGLRDELDARRRAEGTRVVGSPEQVEARTARLLRGGQLSPGALAAPDVAGAVLTPHVLLERVLDHNDLQAVNFLARGARAARTTGRISLRVRGRLVPWGTGFLVAPRLLLTNNHVLRDADEAAGAVVEFNCELDVDEGTAPVAAHGLDPAALFLTDPHLDYTLVAVAPGADGGAPGEVFGWNRLVAQTGKIVSGEHVNVVGHPQGRLKEIAIRDNELGTLLEEFLHYATDTEPGSSGSPVYNDQWEVVALHHSGVPDTDDQGRWLRSDGTPWEERDGVDAVRWLANEGARISVVLAALAAQPLDPAGRALLEEMGPLAIPPAGPAGPAPLPAPEAVAARPAAAQARRADGARARGPAVGATHLVFLHGRAQQGRDPARLRAEWAAGLNRGLALAGLPPVDAADTWFPFYGDVLVAASARAHEALADDGDRGLADAVAPADPPARDLYGELLHEAAGRAGLPPEDTAEEGLGDVVAGLQRPLSWLADVSGVDEAIIAVAFRDVAAYLGRATTRTAVLDAVAATLPERGPVVVVAHSLGTVVALDLLTRLPADLEVVQLVTAGSPLGMDAVSGRLLSGGPRHPERAAAWLNAWSAADAVSIGCPLADDWGDRVREVRTTNARDRAHDIGEYLADRRVSATISAALRGG